MKDLITGIITGVALGFLIIFAIDGLAQVAIYWASADIEATP